MGERGSWTRRMMVFGTSPRVHVQCRVRKKCRQRSMYVEVWEQSIDRPAEDICHCLLNREADDKSLRSAGDLEGYINICF